MLETSPSTTLPAIFQTELNTLPTELQCRATHAWQDFCQAAKQHEHPLPTHPALLAMLPRLWAISDFAAKICCRYPALLSNDTYQKSLHQEVKASQQQTALRQLLDPVQNEAELMLALRTYRNQQQLRIIWRDLAGLASLEQTIQELSAMADACIDQATQKLAEWYCQQYGSPSPHKDLPQELTVIALGKLGGQELNLSSDVDLMFCYPASGQTQHPDNPIAHDQFFTRLGQRLIHVLSHTDANGFVFRVDMRLRPFGKSGPLVMSFDALADYYQTQGRDWERYALLKARIISGNRQAALPLIPMIQQFVYRPDLDFSAIEALRDMHATIISETRSKNFRHNIKLGSGCIREIEFTGQALQLLHGGKIFVLHSRRIQRVLTVLEAEGLLSSNAVAGLKSAYRFLRNTEHCLQAFSDLQTHQLPSEPSQQLRLAYAMQFEDYPAFKQALTQHRDTVHKHFQHVLGKSKPHRVSQTPDTLSQDYQVSWVNKQDQQRLQNLLQDLGFADSEQALVLINSLVEEPTFTQLPERGRQRLNRLLPHLLLATGKTIQPLATLHRLSGVLLALMPHSRYFTLLRKRPHALSYLVQVCAHSSLISHQLAQNPVLIGEILQESRLNAPMALDDLKAELAAILPATLQDEAAIEQAVMRIAQFKFTRVFRVAVLDIIGKLPLMKVSDCLTHIATAVIHATLQLATHKCRLQSDHTQHFEPDQLAIIAYGKLGGLEMSYGSDLDLVFLYDAPDDTAYASMNRLCQQLVQMLTFRNRHGSLYQVDLRLRPSGIAGPLINSFKRFIDYQQQEAWAWEHQSLVRARCISGYADIINRFETLRQQVLCAQRDLTTLQQSIADMRQRMRDAAEPKTLNFDLKQGHGGLADIEFIVQFMVLAYSHQFPAIGHYSDNVRILERLKGIAKLSEPDVTQLIETYRHYRATLHHLDLQEHPSEIPLDELLEQRQQVMRLWQTLITDVIVPA